MDRKSQRFLITILCALTWAFPIAVAAETNGGKFRDKTVQQREGGSQFESRAEAKKKRLPTLNQKMFRRLDFRIEGSSCVACLGRVRSRIDKVKGVYDVAIAIKKPYGAAVIYDSTKTDKDKILDAGKKGESVEIKFEDIQDLKIDDPPPILIPIYNQLKKD